MTLDLNQKQKDEHFAKPEEGGLLKFDTQKGHIEEDKTASSDVGSYREP